jgi:hypothetical protein
LMAVPGRCSSLLRMSSVPSTRLSAVERVCGEHYGPCQSGGQAPQGPLAQDVSRGARRRPVLAALSVLPVDQPGVPDTHRGPKLGREARLSIKAAPPTAVGAPAGEVTLCRPGQWDAPMADRLRRWWLGPPPLVLR